MMISIAHQTTSNADVPIIMSALFGLRNCWEKDHWYLEFIPCSLLILAFMIYPPITYWLIRKQLRELEMDEFQHFNLKHLSSFVNLELEETNNGLVSILVVHYRRILYCAIVVFLSSRPDA